MNKIDNSRWLALRVVDNNVQYGLSYVEQFATSQGDTDIRIEPFDGMEKPSTKFYSGTIHVIRHPFLKLIFK